MKDSIDDIVDNIKYFLLGYVVMDVLIMVSDIL